MFKRTLTLPSLAPENGYLYRMYVRVICSIATVSFVFMFCFGVPLLFAADKACPKDKNTIDHPYFFMKEAYNQPLT